jgi:hypothetical protein
MSPASCGSGPVDVRLDITYLTSTEPWKSMVDRDRIGIAGHFAGRLSPRCGSAARA